MSWVKIEDETVVHRKVRIAGRRAFGLWVAGLCYATRFRTDGRIPKSELPAVWPWSEDGLAEDAKALVTAGMWEDCGDHWLAHDFLEYQESAKEIDRKRRLASERLRRHRETKMQRVANATGETLSSGSGRVGIGIGTGSSPEPPRPASTNDLRRILSLSDSHREALGLDPEHTGIQVTPTTEFGVADALRALGSVDRVIESIEANAFLTASGVKTFEPENFAIDVLLRRRNLRRGLDHAMWAKEKARRAREEQARVGQAKANLPAPSRPPQTCPAWEEAKASLRQQVSGKVFDTWFTQLGARQKNGTLVLVARAAYVADYVNLNLAATLREVVGEFELVLEE